MPYYRQNCTTIQTNQPETRWTGELVMLKQRVEPNGRTDENPDYSRDKPWRWENPWALFTDMRTTSLKNIVVVCHERTKAGVSRGGLEEL